MYGRIYKITNDITNKIYVGKTVKSLEERFKGHCISADGWTKELHGSRLYPSMQKYGYEHFHISLLEECNSEEELCRAEIKWISKLDSTNQERGYNIAPGGNGGALFKGHQHSEETIREMRDSRKGSKNANYGNRWVCSEELKALHSKLSLGSNNGMYGKHHSEETKEKIGKSNSKAITGRIYVSNEELDIEERIYPEQLEYYLSQGFKKKRLKRNCNKFSDSSKGCRWVNNGEKSYLANPERCKELLEQGYVYGRLKSK